MVTRLQPVSTVYIEVVTPAFEGPIQKFHNIHKEIFFLNDVYFHFLFFINGQAGSASPEDLQQKIFSMMCVSIFHILFFINGL